MTSETDVANLALSLLGTRSTIASLTEQSNEAVSAAKWIDSCRQSILRLAPWNSATAFDNLALICAMPGTPENPSAQVQTWQRGIPVPPWAYEYAYPSNCLRPLWIVPQFTTGFGSGVPITTAVTGGSPVFWNGPPVRYKVATDFLANGVPTDPPAGVPAKIILTNQEFALLVYLLDLTNPDVMDEMLIQAWASFLAARMAIDLTGDKQLANLRISDANASITLARQADGNEGLTVNDVVPDFIRVRGIDFPWDFGWSPNDFFDWGGLLTMF